jgi:ATP-dependent RNA circularization protein (DNA/RNA ligase family)
MSEFVRFPRTPHLAVLGQLDIRDDKVLSPGAARAFLSEVVVVEEKVDGENIGLSVIEGKVVAQSRGSYVDLGGTHFQGLESWLRPRIARFVKELGEGLILFGEWCAARHSVRYDLLPDWLLVFDVYDKATASFWEMDARDLMARSLGLSLAPRLDCGLRNLEELEALIGESRLGHAQMEGIVLRHASHPNDRAKLVRPNFISEIGDHWRSRPIQRNRLASTQAA